MLPAALLLLLQAPPALVQAAADPLPPARLEVTSPFPVHLGSVGPREVRVAEFRLRSLADQPFHLRALDLSLGATLDAAQLAAPLAPGEARILRVRVDPTGLVGPVKGAVRLGTDDPAQPAYILRWDLEVRPEVAVDSLRRSLGEVAAHESPEARFRFTREGGAPLKLVLASPLPSYLEAALEPQEGAVELRLTLRPARLDPGTWSGLEVLRVTTNGPQAAFTLTLDWRLTAPVLPSPTRLVYADPDAAPLSLTLTARDGRPFQVLRTQVLGGGFEVLDAPVAPAPEHSLRVRRTTGTMALLEVTCTGMAVPLKVPLRYLDPGAGPTAPPPSP